MKEFEIWSEGYSATGEHSTAHYHGKSFGNTFLEACINFKEPEDIIRGYDGFVIKRKGEPLSMDTNPDGTLDLSFDGRPKIWACRYFDNEIDARKSFG